MSTFLKRFLYAILIGFISYIGIKCFPSLFLTLCGFLSLKELFSCFKPKLSKIFISYAVFIILAFVAFWYILTNYGNKYILWLIAVVCSADIFAYIIGSIIGGPKMCKSISPNKTISGLCGGTAFSIITGAFLSKHMGIKTTLLLTAIITISAILGDLLESYIKRKIGIKDFSHLIPGHGGILDRLDSFIPASIILCIYLILTIKAF